MVNSWEEVAPTGSGPISRTNLPTPFLCLKSRTDPKNLMEALKSISSRAQKRQTHQGSFQFQEPTHIHLNYALYPVESSRNSTKVSKFPFLQRQLLRMMSQHFHPKNNIVGNKIPYNIGHHQFYCMSYFSRFSQKTSQVP